jgi:hypothetical protein
MLGAFSHRIAHAVRANDQFGVAIADSCCNEGCAVDRAPVVGTGADPQ